MSVTKISNLGNVVMGKFISTNPSEQIVIREKSRLKKLERILEDE